ncbi:pilus assembly protein CpaE [Nocardioides coralli]|uniref:pilus assembly protein CpaE n=1 Tax=Nocardioides coralli TaxID=2872154 RepID=UPI001CA45456|nr:pilus assembly protein CpaE [Nocardioides coralli]QZY29654.1 pilus assembly protein CpaE [Nocardioides coralli]
MISLHHAEQLDYLLRSQGREWEPADGDRFVIPGRDLDQVFVVAEMTIEVQEMGTHRLVCFNGTTEWALDSILVEEVLWLPWEHQLRELLGDRFLSLAAHGDAFVVTLTDGTRVVHDDVEEAYAEALLGEFT